MPSPKPIDWTDRRTRDQRGVNYGNHRGRKYASEAERERMRLLRKANRSRRYRANLKARGMERRWVKPEACNHGCNCDVVIERPVCHFCILGMCE